MTCSRPPPAKPARNGAENRICELFVTETTHRFTHFPADDLSNRTLWRRLDRYGFTHTCLIVFKGSDCPASSRPGLPYLEAYRKDLGWAPSHLLFWLTTWRLASSCTNTSTTPPFLNLCPRLLRRATYSLTLIACCCGLLKTLWNETIPRLKKCFLVHLQSWMFQV